MSSHVQDMVFFHNREEVEEYAARLEALTQLLYRPDVRAGDHCRERVSESIAGLEAFARDLIWEADHQEQPYGQPGEMALDRDALRFLCYGILHSFRTIKDGLDETVDGERPHERLSGIYSGFWWLTNRWESERRQEVSDRLERFDRFQRSLERQFAELAPADLEEIAVARGSLTALLEPLTNAATGLTETPEDNYDSAMRQLREQSRKLLAFVEQAPRNPPICTEHRVPVPVYRVRQLGELLRDGVTRRSVVLLREAADLVREVLQRTAE